MYDVYRIKPIKTLVWWIVASLFVWPIAGIALALIGFPVVFIGNMLFEPLMYNDIFLAIIGLLTVPIIGAIIALVMALLQRQILRKYLYWIADKWVRWSVIGGAIGASIVTLLLFFFGDSFFDDTRFLFLMPVFLTCVSSFQLIALRHAVKQAWLWIIANLVGGIVFAALPMNNQPDYYNINYDLIILGVGVLAVLSLGFITGWVLIFLFEKKLLPMRPGTKDDLDDSSEPKSVWDRAI